MSIIKKQKILMLHRIFANYRKPIYDNLAHLYNYILLHSSKDSSIKQATTPYSKSVKTLRYGKGATHFLYENFSPIVKFRPSVFIHENAIGVLTLLPSYILCKLIGVKFILYGHGYYRIHGFNPHKSWSDRYRQFLMRLADATIVYTEKDRQRLGAFTNIEKIFVAQNTLDTSHAVLVRENLEKEGRDSVKQRLNFKHNFNLTYIGRILEEKMPEKILEVFEILQKKMPNQVGIHFIGGGDISILQATIKEYQWEDHIRFYGAIYDEAVTGAFLYASDMMIMPGDLGLSINHAFAYDCPVISFEGTPNGPFHGPESEYVITNETGFLIPNLSVEKMADTILAYIQNQVLQDKIKHQIRFKMEHELTIDNMVKGFTDAIDFVLKKKVGTPKVENTEGVLSK